VVMGGTSSSDGVPRHKLIGKPIRRDGRVA
jgi:hypothetical protein